MNERICEISAGHDRLELICECGRLDCRTTIDIAAAEYAAIRGRRLAFLVVPGHERPGLPEVVLEGGRYRAVAPAVPAPAPAAAAALAS